MDNIELILDTQSQLVTVRDPSPTISVLWDRAVQQAVINTEFGPTIASRAYGIVHTAMYDAWSAYNLRAVGTQLGDNLQRPIPEHTQANKVEAMSYAAYRVLTELFPTEQAIFAQLMAELGFDPNNTTTDPTTPTEIGNLSAEALMEFRRTDGSNQLNGFADTTNYQPVNTNSSNITDIAKWTPEFVPIDSDSNLQQFLTPQWSVVTPFALDSPNAVRPVAPEPFLLVEGATVDLSARTITLSNGDMISISSAIVGTDVNAGAIINQAFIEQAEDVIVISAGLTDEQKLIAEFWEDQKGTSFPPGTWMTFGQFVSARDNNTLDEDVVLFFALGNAVFDAGVATWEAKVFYDYVRPVRAIRELGKLGLLNNGTTGTDAITGETGFVIDAWAGPGEGTRTILAENFLTYQTPGSDPSPPFAEYTSGHSAFSAAGAEILRLFTGSDAFGTSITFQPGESRFEPNVTPTSEEILAWETFTEAADEAGISRIYGGIHFDDGDVNGRTLGRTVGGEVWDSVQSLIVGSDVVNLTFSPAELSSSLEVGFFLVEDAEGTLDGLTPDDAGYLQAALAQSSVLFSSLPENTDIISSFSSSSTRSVLNGSFLQFFTIDGETVDTFLSSGTGTVSLSNIQLVDTTTGNLDLNVEGLINVIQVETSPVGNTFQGANQGEIIDLTGITATSNVTFTVQREASFNNMIGFYVVDDLTGRVTDSTGTQLNPQATAEYIQAALSRRITNVSLSAENRSVNQLSSSLEPGQIIAPFLIVDGSVNQLLDADNSNDPEIYFPYLGANSDGADHIRLFGDNIFGFEDLPNGGDQDFDDFIVQVEFA